MANTFLLSLSRTVAQRHFNRRIKRLHRRVRALALELSLAHGTTFEHELSL
ncbi:hypothetical protein LCGC14_1752890, partial [marine sediment metagenome]